MAELSHRKIASHYWRVARPYRRAYYASFLLMFLTLAMETARPLALNAALGRLADDDAAGLETIALLFLGISIVDYLSRSGFSYIAGLSILRTINRLRDQVFRHVLRMKMAFFDQQPVGKLLTRTINDCESVAETLRAGAATILVDILTVVVVLSVMVTLDWQLTTVMMLSAPLTWLAVKWCGSKLREKFLAVRIHLAESNGYMAEGIQGAAVLQLFGQEAFSSGQYRRINKTYRQSTIHSNVYDALLSALMDGIEALVTAAILMVGFNVRFGLVEAASMVVFIDQLKRIFTPIRDLSGKLATVQQAIAALQRVLGLLDQDERIHQGEKTLEGDRLDIRFDNLSFSYSTNGPRVLDDLNFRVEPGQAIALVGQTGSGKSTIGKLLIRAYDGYQGEIRVGGVELRELNYHSLRAKIAVIHQEVELFPASLRDNISMFDDAIDEDKIMWAIRLVRAEHMLSQLPGGLDFEVHESGTNLSSGQIQLIIFARALAHDAPIVLMDEATSSVDSVTERWIQEAISQILKHKTVITVAHRLSTIAAADRILALKNGRIIEQGSHQELAAIENGYYANLIEASKLQRAEMV